MRNFFKFKSVLLSLLFFGFVLAGCASIMDYAQKDQLKKNEEFENTVKIVVPEETVEPPVDTGSSEVPTTTLPVKVPKKKVTSSKEKKGKVAVHPERRQPDLESDIGFSGRRPLKDPFGVGERITHNVSYMGLSAGTLTLESKPFAQVNSRKNYQFRISIKTISLFSSFYAVDDYVDVLMDFESLIPSVFKLHVRESGQLREAQMYFDHDKLQATYWEKKVTKKDGEENKKQNWEILPYTQSIFSSVFYLRFFKWEVGAENAFRVTDDEKNLIFRGKAVRKEKLSTDAGDFDAVVIKPDVELRGQFQTIGDNYIWLSDDDHRYILRIESKIKIGTLVSEVEKIEPGR